MVFRRLLLIALGVGSCIAAPAVARAASIRVTAPVEAVGVGDEFLLAVRVTPDPNQPIDAVQAYLDFDANAIEILELIPQAPLSTVLRSVVDNAGGTADFTAGSLTSLPAAEFTLVTLRVRAVGETAATQISLHAALPRASNATRQGAFLNPELVDASFPVAAVGTPVAVVAVAPAGPLLVGELMDIDIQVRAGARLIDGAAVSLDFDPAIAQVVSITAGAALPTVLANRIDNAGGQIDFAAGAFSNWPSETFQLCRIQFRGMAPGTTTILSSTVLSRPTQVTFAGRSLPLEFRAAAITVQPAAQSANLVLEPSATSVSAGDVFEVRVVVHSGTQPIDGAAAFVDFDSTVLQVLSITPGIPLSTPILNHFDNQLGRVDIAAGQLTALPSQDITVATIRFQALGGAPQTTLALAVEPPRQSDVTYAGASILADLEGATIEIGSTDPRVTLEIVSEAPAPSVGDSFDLIVRVRAGAQRVDGASAYINIDPAAFQLLGVTAGAALGAVLQREFDSASGIVALAAGEFGPAPAGTFELGRIRVRALRAGNTTVSLATEPGRQSDVTFGGASVLTDLSPLSLAIATSGVELAVVAPQSVVRVGDEINVTIEARTGVKQVDGVAAYLDFDPTIFEVVSVSAGTNLPAVIYRSFDNRKGSVDLAVGTLGAFPSGNISVGVVRLRAIGGPTETTVTFASLTSRQSDVTFAGQSLLAIAHDVTFQVATGDVVLAVVAPPTVDGGRSFALQLEVRAGNQPVDGAAAYLDFDPATFRVLRIVPGTALSTEIEASFDNSAGRVNFIAGDLDNIPSGTFTLATLELLPLRAITASDLRFSVNLPRRSDASYSGTSVLLTRSGARIAVQGPVCFLDLDATGGAPTAETDGYWLYRNLVGLRAVPSATRASNPTLIADASIAAVIDAIRPALDFDGDGQPRAATDAVYLHRLLDGQTPVVPDLFRTAGAPASETVSDAIRNLCCLPELGCVQESAAATCIGDCGGNDRVSVEELISGVSIALGTTSIEQCSTLDANLDAVVTVDELLLAADQALHGCPESGVHFSAATGAATR